MTEKQQDQDQTLLLGRQVPVVEQYCPQLLQAIPRSLGREAMDIKGKLPFFGEDVWHAYELSWLEPGGRPRVAVGRFCIPADSPNLVESKSLKLYLHSFNNTEYQSINTLSRSIAQDMSAVVGAQVGVRLMDSQHPSLNGESAEGVCVDQQHYHASDSGPDAKLLICYEGQPIEETLHSHLLRSLCPVTGQPDWATVVVKYHGKPIDRASLLRYIVAYRQHQEFHEQCVERMFIDIAWACEPKRLEVQAFYTRRGGLDICPWRSSHQGRAAILRLNRQ